MGPGKLQAWHARNAVLTVQPDTADDIFRPGRGADALFKDQGDDQAYDAEIDIADSAVDDEVTEQSGEEHGQKDRGGKGPGRRARVQGEDRIAVTAEPEENRLSEAQDADIAP